MRKLPPGALMRMVSPSATQQSTSAVTASRKSSAAKQRITPTAVQSLERSASFLPSQNASADSLKPSGEHTDLLLHLAKQYC